MEILSEALAQKVGNNKTSIKKIPHKEKKEFKKLLVKELDKREPSIPNTLLLRIQLALGESVNEERKSYEIITNALNLKDILRYANNLSTREEIIDAANLFDSISNIIQNSKSKKIIKPIVSCIYKWLKWVESLRGQLTEQTEASIISVIRVLISIIPPPKSLSEKTLLKYKKQLLPLIQILIDLVLRSIYFKTYISFLKIINSIANKYPSLIINDLLSIDEISNKMDSLKDIILGKFELQILNGKAEEDSEIYRTIKQIHFANWNTLFEQKMSEIWEKHGSILNRDMQTMISNHLLKEYEAEKTFESSIVEDTDSSIKHLATALISVWESRNEGSRSKDSFNLLASVAEKYFNLKIVDNVGETTRFNKIAHETLNAERIDENSEVVIIRPRIEWESPGKKVIIIKSLVIQKD